MLHFSPLKYTVVVQREEFVRERIIVVLTIVKLTLLSFDEKKKKKE